MAELVDSCCVTTTMSGPLTKPDKNNNTTANLDDGDLGSILPSEQSDVIEDGTDEKSESVSFHSPISNTINVMVFGIF